MITRDMGFFKAAGLQTARRCEDPEAVGELHFVPVLFVGDMLFWSHDIAYHSEEDAIVIAVLKYINLSRGVNLNGS